MAIDFNGKRNVKARVEDAGQAMWHIIAAVLIAGVIAMVALAIDRASSGTTPTPPPARALVLPPHRTALPSYTTTTVPAQTSPK
jgi:uncharacterized membrane protein